MQVQTDGAIAGMNPAASPGATAPRTNRPAFVEFSLPALLTDPWANSSAEVLTASLSSLIGKERHVFSLLLSARRARALSGGMLPDALAEAERHFAGHWDALAAVYPKERLPLTRNVDRVRHWVSRAFRAGAAWIMPPAASYAARLNELFSAASELSIGYVTLQATSISLGDRCAAAVAARHLRHLGQLLLVLHTLVPYEFVYELRTRGLNASTDDLWEVAGVTALPC